MGIRDDKERQTTGSFAERSVEDNQVKEKVLVRLWMESKNESVCKNKAASIVAEDEVEEYKEALSWRSSWLRWIL